MYFNALLDMAVFILFVWTAIGLLTKTKWPFLHDPVKSPLVVILFLSISYYMLISLKWVVPNKTTNHFENIVEVLITVWWGFLFYGLIQKLSKLELVRSKQQYQLVLDNISEVIVKLDDQHRIRFATPSFYQTFGKNESEFATLPFATILQIKDGQPDLEADFITQATLPPFETYHETLVETRDGLRWFAWHVTYLTRNTKTENGFLVVGRDITEKQTAEQSLRESNDRHRQFIDNQPVGMFRSAIEGNGQFIMANPALAKLLGFPSVEALMATPVESLYPYPEFKNQLLARLADQGTFSDLELEGKRRDGSPLFLKMALRLVKDSQNVPWQIDGTIEDISARKAAEAALKKRELLHRKAQRIAKLGHWEMVLDGSRPTWSEEMYRIFELDKSTCNSLASDRLNEIIFERVHPEERKAFTDMVDHAMKTFSPTNQIDRILLPDGRIKYVQTISHFEVHGNGQATRWIGTSQDVTQLKEAEMEKEKSERRLLQAQRLEAIGTLAGGIAHDFNNILASIIGFSQLAIQDVPSDSPMKRRLDVILQGGIRARDLVANMLSFSRQSEQEFKPTQVQIIVKEVIKLLRATIPANIKIRHELSLECGHVLADPVQVHQIVMNLCTNAYQAIGKKEGAITIALKQVDVGPDSLPLDVDIAHGTYVHLMVSDNGPGMSTAVLDKIFDPYFTTKKRGEGTGLGLFVVRGIVEKHRGYIAARSEAGHGSAFHVFLPCLMSKCTADEITAQNSIIGGTEHIVVVDDEIPIAAFFTEFLTGIGYRITKFTDSNKALIFINSHPKDFDLLITDMNMPTMCGDELAKHVISANPDMPIIICTGFSDEVDEAVADKMGINAIIRKPATGNELAACIRTVLN